ncbi:MAG: helix-turn-helix transcriptional regulator [Planctomycetes bacterium]|nr:helix-turn-helix transcriptional regulator [Planctomycetota bacterium]
MGEHAASNLWRLMAQRDLTAKQVVARTGLDERTIKGIVNGTNKPHARTIHRLAKGLGISVDELLLDPAVLRHRQFDRQTNPVVAEVIDAQAALFDGWTDADFDELHSRFGHGGPLTAEGTVATVKEMNQHRRLHEKLALLLESSQAEVIGGILELMYEKVVVKEEPA